ncbi:hypothetical protein Taro_040596, partial [Colocasia esculenta]|nr:hypothetical protein [Colocasia esculenta]
SHNTDLERGEREARARLLPSLSSSSSPSLDPPPPPPRAGKIPSWPVAGGWPAEMAGVGTAEGQEPRGYSLSARQVAAAAAVVAGFGLGLLGVYLSMPASDYSFLKLPRSLDDLQVLRPVPSLPAHPHPSPAVACFRCVGVWGSGNPSSSSLACVHSGVSIDVARDHLEDYTSDYTLQVLVGYCTVYIFMQTFMIPGTIFMSLLAGALFGVLRGVALVVFAATAGASSCYFLSNLIGKPLVFSLWPDKLSFFQAQVAKRRKKLLNYMLFLRVTPTLPNTFINVASPIVDVPYHTFFLGTILGLIPAAYVTVRAGIALGELRSIGDLYDLQSMATLFLIGVISVTPTLISKSQTKGGALEADITM